MVIYQPEVMGIDLAKRFHSGVVRQHDPQEDIIRAFLEEALKFGSLVSVAMHSDQANHGGEHGRPSLVEAECETAIHRRDGDLGRLTVRVQRLPPASDVQNSDKVGAPLSLVVEPPIALNGVFVNRFGKAFTVQVQGSPEMAWLHLGLRATGHFHGFIPALSQRVLEKRIERLQIFNTLHRRSFTTPHCLREQVVHIDRPLKSLSTQILQQLNSGGVLPFQGFLEPIRVLKKLSTSGAKGLVSPKIDCLCGPAHLARRWPPFQHFFGDESPLPTGLHSLQVVHPNLKSLVLSGRRIEKP